MKKLLPLALITAALVSWGVPSNASADSIFLPKTYAHLCNSMPTNFPDADVAGAGQTVFEPNCAENLQTGAFADVTLTTDLVAANVGIAEQITFFPSNSAITLGSTIPAGTKLGGSRIIESFSFSGGPCSTVFSTDFILYNVALPNNTGDPRASTNIAFPRNEGQADRFGAWQTGSPPANGGPDNVTDANGDTRADGTTLSIQNYPSYLLDAFDPDKTPGAADGPLPPLVPRAVYGGLSLLMGEWQPLYLVQFSPGQLAALPGHYSLMASAMGHPLVFLQGDPSATIGSPSAIIDRCTPLTATTLLRGRDPSLSHTRYTNAVCTSPATQCTHFMVKYLASLRDTDQDGFENTIDSCPGQVNAGSPKTGAGDPDSDGLDDICDPTPLLAGADPDGDAYPNRGDNCPLDSNPGQPESEASVVPPDRGPRRDEIGDPCDTGTISVTQNGRTFNITLSPTVANGRYHVAANHVAKCYGPTSAGGTDADGDGYCTTQDNTDSGSCGFTDACRFRHTAWNASTPAR